MKFRSSSFVDQNLHPPVKKLRLSKVIQLIFAHFWYLICWNPLTNTRCMIFLSVRELDLKRPNKTRIYTHWFKTANTVYSSITATFKSTLVSCDINNFLETWSTSNILYISMNFNERDMSKCVKSTLFKNMLSPPAGFNF